MTLQNQVTKLLSEKVHIDAPSPDTDLMESGLLDSLTLVELIVGLEEEFGIRVPFEDVELDHFRTINQIAGFIEQKSEIREMTTAHTGS